MRVTTTQRSPAGSAPIPWCLEWRWGLAGRWGRWAGIDKVALRPLTVDFHEPGVVAGLNEEDQFTQQKGFWFQLSSDEQGKAKTPWGPANPQALNRYSYVLNNPLRYTDPTGHVLTQSYWWGTRIALSAEDLKAIAHVLLEYSSEEIIGALVLAGFGEEEAAIIAAAAIFLGPTALLAIAEAHNHLEIYLIGGLPLLWAEIHGGDEPPTDLSNLQPANPIKWPECKGGCSGSYPTGGGVIPVQPTLIRASVIIPAVLPARRVHRDLPDFIHSRIHLCILMATSLQ